MRLSTKILLGLATLSPFVFAAAIVAVFFYLVSNAPTTGFEEYIQPYFAIMNLICLFFSLYFTAIMVIFIVHAARNPNVEASGMRTTWLLLLIILGPWVMPFYWFHHIWRDSPAGVRSGPLGLH